MALAEEKKSPKHKKRKRSKAYPDDKMGAIQEEKTMNILTPEDEKPSAVDKKIESDEENGASHDKTSDTQPERLFVPPPAPPRAARARQQQRRQEMAASAGPASPRPIIALPAELESDEEAIPLDIYSPKSNVNLDDDGNVSDVSVYSQELRVSRPRRRHHPRRTTSGISQASLYLNTNFSDDLL